MLNLLPDTRVYHRIPILIVFATCFFGCAANSGISASPENPWLGNWIAVSETPQDGLPQDFLSPRSSLLLTITEESVRIHDLSGTDTFLAGQKWRHNLRQGDHQLKLHTSNLEAHLEFESQNTQRLWLVSLQKQGRAILAGIRFRPVTAWEAQTHFLNSRIATTPGAGRENQYQLPEEAGRHWDNQVLQGHWQLMGFRSGSVNHSLQNAVNTSQAPTVVISIFEDRLEQHTLFEGQLTMRTLPLSIVDDHLELGLSGEFRSRIRWLSQSEEFLYLEPLSFAEGNFLERYQKIVDLPKELKGFAGM